MLQHICVLLSTKLSLLFQVRKLSQIKQYYYVTLLSNTKHDIGMPCFYGIKFFCASYNLSMYIYVHNCFH